MSDSWREANRVSGNEIADRLETIRTLKDDGLEMYEIAKDRASGDHYLHYAYMHRSLAAAGPGAGQEEVFHQLMPVSSDDVLSLLFSDAPYEYPRHWDKPFLRNGPEGDYVWFDPSYAAEETEHEAIGHQITEQLRRFKEAGELSEDAVRDLLKRLDDSKKE